jgi:hypothetical protein
MSDATRRSGRKRTANFKYVDDGLPEPNVDTKRVNKRLRDARYRASQESEAKRKEAKAKRKEAYDPVKRKEAYDPEARRARHQATYNPAARKASYVAQLPQWCLTNVDKIPQHTKVKQEWGYDDDEKCPYCMCIFLGQRLLLSAVNAATTAPIVNRFHICNHC